MKEERSTLVTKLSDLDMYDINSQRDDCGQWVYPLYAKYFNTLAKGKEYLNSEEWETLKNDLNIDIKVIQLEDVVSGEVFEEIMDKCDLSEWKPTPDEGYFIIDIGFNEDGAYCTTAKSRVLRGA